MPADDPLRARLLALLDERGARVPFSEATEGVPKDAQGERPGALPYSPWELVEHARLAQRDILDYCRSEARDLHASVPHATDETHTLVRQVLLVADHTSYHTGQIVAARRLLGCWPIE